MGRSFYNAPQRSAVCFVCVPGACGGMARFLQIAAQLTISHVDNPAIAPLQKTCWELQSSQFIHRVIGSWQKP
jgi:hypothetical protein